MLVQWPKFDNGAYFAFRLYRFLNTQRFWNYSSNREYPNRTLCQSEIVSIKSIYIEYSYLKKECCKNRANVVNVWDTQLECSRTAHVNERNIYRAKQCAVQASLLSNDVSCTCYTGCVLIYIFIIQWLRNFDCDLLDIENYR